MSRKLVLVLVVAFAVRVVAGVLSGSTQGGDASEYLRLAHNLATGHGYSLATHAPFTPTDWRPPAYAALLVPVEWLDGRHFGVVILNALLGTAAVWAVALIARRVFWERPRLGGLSAWAAAVYPPAVTFTGLVLSENLSAAAGCWLVYLLFFAVIGRGRHLALWLSAVFVAGSMLILDRAEGILIVLLGLLLAVAVRRIRITLAGIALVAVLIVPAAWVSRNDAELGRIELTDAVYRDANLLLSVNDGDPTDPLYRRGVALAYAGTSNSTERAAYHRAVMQRVSEVLRARPADVLSFKAKALGNFVFVPLVWNWALEHFTENYTLGDAVRHLNARDAARVAWSLVLVVQYAAALLGLWLWVRQRRYREVCGLLVYPVVALALTIPFQADERQWWVAGFLMLVPAAEGVAWIVRRSSCVLARPKAADA